MKTIQPFEIPFTRFPMGVTSAIPDQMRGIAKPSVPIERPASIPLPPHFPFKEKIQESQGKPARNGK